MWFLKYSVIPTGSLCCQSSNSKYVLELSTYCKFHNPGGTVPLLWALSRTWPLFLNRKVFLVLSHGNLFCSLFPKLLVFSVRVSCFNVASRVCVSILCILLIPGVYFFLLLNGNVLFLYNYVSQSSLRETEFF